MPYALTVPGISQLLEAWDAKRSCFGVEVCSAEAMWNVLVSPPNTACTVQALHFTAQRLGLGWTEDTAQLVLATIAGKPQAARVSKAAWDAFWQAECAAWAARQPSRSATGTVPKHGEWVDSDSESSAGSGQAGTGLQPEDSRVHQLLQLGAAWQTTRASRPTAALPAGPQHAPQASHGTRSLCSSADQGSPVRAPLAPAAEADSPLGSVIFGLHSPEPHPVAEPASWIKSQSPGLGARARASQSSALKPRPVARGWPAARLGPASAAGRAAGFTAAAAHQPVNSSAASSPAPARRAQRSPSRRQTAQPQRSPRPAARAARGTPRHTSDTMATLSTVLSALLQDHSEAAALLRDAVGSPVASSEHAAPASPPAPTPVSASAALASPALMWMPSPSPRLAAPPGAPNASPARSESAAVDALARAASMIQACLAAGTPEHLAAARELQAAALAASQALQAQSGGARHGSVESDATSHTGGLMPPLASNVDVRCAGAEGHVLRSPFSALLASVAQHCHETQPSSDSIAAAAAAAFPPFACKPTNARRQLRVAQLPLRPAWVATQRIAEVQHTEEQPVSFEVAWHGSGTHAGGAAQFALSALATSADSAAQSSGPLVEPVQAFDNTLTVTLPSLELHPAAAAQAHEALCMPWHAGELDARVSLAVLDGAALAETHLVWQPLVCTARKWLAFIAVLDCPLHAKLGARVQRFISLHEQHCDTPGSHRADFSDVSVAQQYLVTAFQASASINAMRLAAAAMTTASSSSSSIAGSLLLAAIDRPECCSSLSHAVYAATWTSQPASSAPQRTRAVLLAGAAVGRELGAVASVGLTAKQQAALEQHAPAAAGSAPDTLYCSDQLARMLYLQVVQCCASQQGNTAAMPWLQPVCTAPVRLHVAVVTADTIPLLLCHSFGDANPLGQGSSAASQYGIAADAVLPASGMRASQPALPLQQVQHSPFHLLHFAVGDAVSALALQQTAGWDESHALAASLPAAVAAAARPAAALAAAPTPAAGPASPLAASGAAGAWDMPGLTAPSTGWDASQTGRSRLSWHTPRPIVSGSGSAQQSAAAAGEAAAPAAKLGKAKPEEAHAEEAALATAQQRSQSPQRRQHASASEPATHATLDWGLAQLCQLLNLPEAPKPSVEVARVRSSLVRAATLVGLPSGSPALSTVTLAAALSAMAGPSTDPLRIAAAVQAVAGGDQRVDVHDLCDALTVISSHAQAAGLRAAASSPASHSTAARSSRWRPASTRAPVAPAESKHPTGLQLPPHRAGHAAPPPLPTFGTISTPGTAFVAKAGLTRWEDELMALDAALADEEAQLSPAS